MTVRKRIGRQLFHVHDAIARVSPHVARAALVHAFHHFLSPQEKQERSDGMAAALSGAGAAALRKIMVRHLHVLGDVRHAQRYMTTLSPRALRAFIRDRTSIDMTAGARAVIGSQRPIVLISPHLGHYTVAALVLGVFFQEKARRFGVFYNPPLTNPFSPVMSALFERLDCGAVPLMNDRPGLLNAFRMLRSGAAVGIMPDFAQLSEATEYVPFFSHYYTAMPGTAVMALRNGAAVLPVRCSALTGRRYAVHVEDPVEYEVSGDEGADRLHLTANVMRAVQRLIESDPAQWAFWNTFTAFARAPMPVRAADAAEQLRWLRPLLEPGSPPDAALGNLIEALAVRAE